MVKEGQDSSGQPAVSFAVAEVGRFVRELGGSTSGDLLEKMSLQELIRHSEQLTSHLEPGPDGLNDRQRTARVEIASKVAEIECALGAKPNSVGHLLIDLIELAIDWRRIPSA
jgi:hypothetical protein